MTSATDFAKMVPGFDFLQGLMKSAGAQLPGMSQWIAPTLNPQEIDKRIDELRTVQFWLEQNAKLLATTIQALEVQRMTLSTLQTMNLPLADLRDALKIATPAAGAAVAAKPMDQAPAARARSGARKSARTGAATAAPPAVDPMQWWGALTQQFAELAAKAMRDSAGDAARNLAGAVVRQSIDSAGQVLGKAAAAPVKAAAATAGAVAGVASAAARRRRG
ncbi:MAG: hypothetical protein AMXMBFR66_15640 [Pseudomonadota bacterium]|nr:hypothetical protein [Rubrivivax sp.]